MQTINLYRLNRVQILIETVLWRNIAAWLFACTNIIVLTGCATIFNSGKSMDVRFNSEPEGARLQLSAGYGECPATPCVLNLAKDKSYAIKASKEGFEDTSYYLRSRITKWTWANFAWLYLPFVGIAFGVDFLTQSFWVLENNKVLIRLKEPAEEEEPEEDEPEPEPEPKCSPPTMTTNLKAVQERFTEGFIDEQISFYRGKLSDEQQCKTRNMVMQNLVQMYEAGERLDIDEAFRREYFQRQGETPIPK